MVVLPFSPDPRASRKRGVGVKVALHRLKGAPPVGFTGSTFKIEYNHGETIT